jgi:hypothetical protein
VLRVRFVSGSATCTPTALGNSGDGERKAVSARLGVIEAVLETVCALTLSLRECTLCACKANASRGCQYVQLGLFKHTA